MGGLSSQSFRVHRRNKKCVDTPKNVFSFPFCSMRANTEEVYHEAHTGKNTSSMRGGMGAGPVFQEVCHHVFPSGLLPHPEWWQAGAYQNRGEYAACGTHRHKGGGGACGILWEAGLTLNHRNLLKGFNLRYIYAPPLTNGLRKCGIYTQWNFMQP
jgi:hypothetical protein